MISIRNSVRILLFNEKNELLLMRADDPSTTRKDGKYNGPFWFLIGGQIEKGETLKVAAERELFEETGIKKEEVVFGPIVWHGEVDIILSGIPTHLEQSFIVAKTKRSETTLHNLTEDEKKVIKQLKWFSLERIKNSPEVIYPTSLAKYLPDIIALKYPKSPIEIDLN